MNKKFLKKTVAVTTTVSTTIALSGVSLFAPIFVAVAADIIDGDIMKTADNPDVYIAKHVGDNKYKRLILNPEVFESYDHLEWDNIETVTQAEMDVYTTSELVRAVGDPKVYKLTPDGDIGTRQWVNMTSAEFVSEGYDWDSIYEINTVDRNNYTLGADVTPGDVAVVAPVAPVDGGVALSLASESPAGTSIAKGAANVTFAKINFTGGDSNTTITGISVTRSGLAADADITDVKIWDGNDQLDSTQAINTTTHKAVFTGLSWVVPSGFTKVLTITASIATAPTVGNAPTFGIAGGSDIVGAASVSGTFPVYGNQMTIAGVSVGILDVTERLVPGNNNPISGSTDQEVASWTIDAENEGMSVRSIKITQIGSAANDDISNIVLKISGVQIGSTVTALATDGTALFDLSSDPISINSGSSKVVYAHADVATGITTSRTVQFEITNATDVVGFGTNSAGSVTVTTDMDSSNSAANSITYVAQAGIAQTISQGSLPTVTANSATNPSSQTFVVGTTQQLISAFRFSAGTGEDYAITRLKLGLGDAGNAGAADVGSSDLSNVTLYVYDVATGSETQAGTPTGFVGSTATYGANSSGLDQAVFEIPSAGNTVIHVRADIPSGAAWTGADLGVFVSEARVDGLSSKADIGAATITAVDAIGDAAITKHSQVGLGTLSMLASPNTPAAADVVPGKLKHEFMKVDFTATSEDIVITSLTVNLCEAAACSNNATPNGDSGDFTNVKLWNGNDQLGSTVGAPSSTAGFSFNLEVKKNETVTVTVTADVPTDAATSDDAAASGWNGDTANFSIDKDIVATGLSSSATIVDPAADAIGLTMSATGGSIVASMASTPPDSTYVKNTSQALVARLVLTAGTAEDVKITQIKIGANDEGAGSATACEVGDLTTAVATTADTETGSLTLYVDGVAVTVAKDLTNVASDTDTVTYSGSDFLSNVIVTAGNQVAFDLKLNIKLVSADDLCFGIEAAADVKGSGLSSGASIDSTGTGVSQDMVFAAAGGLTVALDAASPVATILAVGTDGLSSTEFTRWKFTATTEDIHLKSIKLTRTGGGDNDFDSIAIYNASGDKVSSNGYLSSGTVTFNLPLTGSGMVIVPKDGTLVLSAKAVLKGTSTGVTSSDAPILGIANDDVDVVAKGMSSGGNLSGNWDATNTSTGNAMTLYKSKPTFAICDSSCAGGATPSGTLNPVSMTVLRFTITADAEGDVIFDGTNHNVRFTVIGSQTDSDTTNGDLTVYRKDTGAEVGGNTPANNLAAPGATPNAADMNVTIAAGETMEFYVDVLLADYESDGDSFQLQIANASADVSWGDGIVADIAAGLVGGLPLTGGSFVNPS